MNNIFYRIKDLKKTLLKSNNAKLGLCHGVFDVLHYGHINHIIEAKKKSDILIVSITADKFVNKGIPFNNENNRAFLLSSIKYIDYVLVNNVAKAKRQGYDFTKKQLVAWGVKFNKLIFGKPSYDLIIDDKSLFFKNDWFKSFRKK